MIPAVVTWDGDPTIFTVGALTLRWYSFLFASGFVLSHYFLQKIWREEGRDPRMVDTGIVLVIVLSLAFARLAHCLFYEPEVYLADPAAMLNFWKGGLASHGGFVGTILAVWLTLKLYPGMTLVQTLDRAAMFAIFSGALIRFGNVFNGEIVGRPTDGTWGVIFPEVDELARHPAQLYEACGYLAVFALLLALFYRTKAKARPGTLFGLTCVLSGLVRIAAEGFKDEPFMGQVLTLPFLVTGVAALVWARRPTRPKLEEGLPALPRNA